MVQHICMTLSKPVSRVKGAMPTFSHFSRVHGIFIHWTELRSTLSALYNRGKWLFSVSFFEIEYVCVNVRAAGSSRIWEVWHL